MIPILRCENETSVFVTLRLFFFFCKPLKEKCFPVFMEKKKFREKRNLVFFIREKAGCESICSIFG